MTPDVVNGKLDFTRRQALQSLDALKDYLIFPLNLYIRDDIVNDAPHNGTGQFLTVAGFNNQPFFPDKFQYNLRSIDQDISAALGLKRATLEHLNIVNIDSYNLKAYIDGYEQNSKVNIFPSWVGRTDSGDVDLSAADELAETQPQTLFNKLFPNTMGGTASADEIKARRKKSILDSLVTDISSLRTKLSSFDQAQLDRYLTSVRDLETSTTAPDTVTCTIPAANSYGTTSNFSNVTAFKNYTKQMMEIIALAMACDRVRMVTYLLDSMIYGRQYSILYPIEFHATTHLDGTFGTASQTTDMRYQEYRAYNKMYTEMFAYLVQLLKDNGSLDSSLLAFGSGTNMYRSSATSASDHCSHDLPVILAGGANGMVTPGKVVDLGKKVRLGTLWQKFYKIATGKDLDLGLSLGNYVKNAPGSVIFSRSDNIDIPL